MANDFYNRGANFNPDELADGDAIEAEFDAIGRGFDTIEDLVNANKAGYPTQTFQVATATSGTHAVPKAQMDTALGLKLDAVKYNASDILTKLKTVDGTGSGLDADLLDGQDGSYYRNASNINAGTLAKERLPASIDASTTGNAATATTLQTGRTINNVSFNGSANITVEPYVEQDTGTNATRYLTFVDSSTAGYQRLNLDTAMSYNPSTNLLSVKASSANKLSTARTITLGGDLSGSASFDGSANITITASVLNVAVLQGTIAHGGTIPLPSGFTEAQCKWLVSVNDSNSGGDTWDLRDGVTVDQYHERCFTTGRVVSCYSVVQEDATDATETHNGIANYIIIGVK